MKGAYRGAEVTGTLESVGRLRYMQWDKDPRPHTKAHTRIEIS